MTEATASPAVSILIRSARTAVGEPQAPAGGDFLLSQPLAVTVLIGSAPTPPSETARPHLPGTNSLLRPPTSRSRIFVDLRCL